MSSVLRGILLTLSVLCFIYGIIITETCLELFLGISCAPEKPKPARALFTVVDVVSPPAQTVSIGGIFVFSTSDRYLRVQSSDIQLELLIDSKGLSHTYYLGDALYLNYVLDERGYRFPGVICLDKYSTV